MRCICLIKCYIRARHNPLRVLFLNNKGEREQKKRVCVSFYKHWTRSEYQKIFRLHIDTEENPMFDWHLFGTVSLVTVTSVLFRWSRRCIYRSCNWWTQPFSLSNFPFRCSFCYIHRRHLSVICSLIYSRCNALFSIC